MKRPSIAVSPGSTNVCVVSLREKDLVRKVTRILTVNHKDPVLEISQRSVIEVSDLHGNLVEEKNKLDFSETLNTNDEWDSKVELAEVRTRWKGDRIETTLRADEETRLVRPGADSKRSQR